MNELPEAELLKRIKVEWNIKHESQENAPKPRQPIKICLKNQFQMTLQKEASGKVPLSENTILARSDRENDIDITSLGTSVPILPSPPTEIYCCGRTELDAFFMIQCDKCDKWFHGSCINLTSEQADSLAKWFCRTCSPKPRPSLKLKLPAKKEGPQSPTSPQGEVMTLSSNMKPEMFSPTVSARSAKSDPVLLPEPPKPKKKSTHIETFEDLVMSKDTTISSKVSLSALDFLGTLRNFSHNLTTRSCVQQVRAADVTKEKLKDGFNYPLMLQPEERDALGIQLPSFCKDFPEDSTPLSRIKTIIAQLFPLIDPTLTRPVPVFNVETQNEETGWNLANFSHYFQNSDMQSRLLNVISLEFSDTPLNDIMKSPSIVREIDWIDTVWPSPEEFLNLLNSGPINNQVTDDKNQNSQIQNNQTQIIQNSNIQSNNQVFDDKNQIQNNNNNQIQNNNNQIENNNNNQIENNNNNQIENNNNNQLQNNQLQNNNNQTQIQGSKKINKNYKVMSRPKVQKYCLMSVAGSYTDWHIDFGGSSVWYHLVEGEKLFLFAPPTESNLSCFQQWSNSPEQAQTPLHSLLSPVYFQIVKRGCTLFIPTGWIHAVFTPKQSLVFGGNFLHSFNVATQIATYDLEKNVGIEQKFLFPEYERIVWFAALKLAAAISSNQPLSNAELCSVMQLVSTLDAWIQNSTQHQYVPTLFLDQFLSTHTEGWPATGDPGAAGRKFVEVLAMQALQAQPPDFEPQLPEDFYGTFDSKSQRWVVDNDDDDDDKDDDDHQFMGNENEPSKQHLAQVPSPFEQLVARNPCPTSIPELLNSVEHSIQQVLANIQRIVEKRKPAAPSIKVTLSSKISPASPLGSGVANNNNVNNSSNAASPPASSSGAGSPFSTSAVSPPLPSSHPQSSLVLAQPRGTSGSARLKVVPPKKHKTQGRKALDEDFVDFAEEDDDDLFEPAAVSQGEKKKNPKKPGPPKKPHAEKPQQEKPRASPKKTAPAAPKQKAPKKQPSVIDRLNSKFNKRNKKF